jgi:hypothetical protein
MGISALLPLLVISILWGQDLQLSKENASILVLSFKWSTTHQAIRKPDVPTTSPPPEMNAGNKSGARAARANNPLIPDPNEQTIDGRSATMEKNVQEARSSQPKPMDGFSYQAKIQNAGPKLIEIVFWEYQFIDTTNKETVGRRQFLCGVKIKPDKERELQGFSFSGPSNVIRADTLARKPENPFQEKVIINRVEYGDGSIWQRQDWNFAEVKSSYKRALETPWGSEMCREL